jgi:hypothetical protein
MGPQLTRANPLHLAFQQPVFAPGPAEAQLGHDLFATRYHRHYGSVLFPF